MRQRVLKALANPARIFYVPYNMAILNFAVQFLVFIAVFVASLLWTGGKNPVSPLWFLVSFKARPPTGPNFGCKNTTVQKEDTKQIGGIKNEWIF